MRLLVASIIMPLFFSLLTPAFAIETPRIIPRMREVQKPVDEVFDTVRKYFTDSQLSRFQLVSADKATHTLVARQSGIDDQSWSDWAFCQAGPVQMIYKLQDGTVTVTVKLEKATRHSTFATVSADFQGTYALGANQNKVACTSKFALEDNLLAVAGGAPAK